MIKKIILSLSLSIYAISFSYGSEFFCHINMAGPKQSVPLESIKKYIYDFRFATNSKIGKSITFKKYMTYIWMKKKKLYILVRNEKSKLQLSTSYLPSREEIILKVSPNYSLKCLSKKRFNSEQGSGINNFIHKKLESNSELARFTDTLAFNVRKPLKFKYRQRLVTGKMRPIIFQNGKQLTSDMPLVKDQNWCIFQIQVKLDQDITIGAGSSLNTISYKGFSNNNKFDNYSYSFVDFSKGKKTQETLYYAPFSFNCSIKKGASFTYNLFKYITGEAISLSVKKAKK